MLYRIYKQAAEWLIQRENNHLRTYLHIASQQKSMVKPVIGEISLAELVNAAQSVFLLKPKLPFMSDVVSIPKVTIREKIHAIMEGLMQKPLTTFRELIKNNPTRIEVVITFLAVLELIKRHIVQVEQNHLFADIDLQLIQEWNPPDEFELEFEE